MFGWVIPYNTTTHGKIIRLRGWFGFIRVYFLLFPVSLYAFTVSTGSQQVRHCVMCRLLHPFTLQVQAVTGSVRAVTGSVRELVRI